MNPLIQLKKATPPFLGVFVLICLTLSPRVQAVVPAPDGGYPNGNTAEGSNALFSLTSGIFNTAIGNTALYFNTTGNYNTATGADALIHNTFGIYNTANGYQALYSNTFGYYNTATGFHALYSNTDINGVFGGYNTATGAYALSSNTTGTGNTANGLQALFHNTTANNNTANGYFALDFNVTGTQNTATGAFALQKNNAANNTATGFQALLNNTMGSSNTATGESALKNNTTANNNTADGFQVLFHNMTGASNTAVGYHALLNNNGSSNIGLGFNAGANLTVGSNNIDIGSGGAAGESNTIRIGSAQTRSFIKGISGAAIAGAPVVVNAGGQLGVAASSARFKEEIQPMGNASDAILALKPVTFRYKQKLDPKRMQQFGLVAEEVAQVNPDLVVRDEKGEIYTVRYEAVNAMLLNEFLKEHRKVQEQEATIAQLKSTLAKKETIDAHQQEQIEALTAGLQKVSAQVELSKSAPQTAENNH